MEVHFLKVLHVHSTDADTIAEALQSQQQKQLDLRKLIGQGYDGAASFAGKISGVHSESRPLLMQSTSTGNRLQLASIQAAASVKEKRMFLEP